MSDDFQEKKHYYLVYFTFSGNDEHGDANMIHSNNNKGFINSESLKSVHISIKEWLEENGVFPDVVVLNNFSYLGEMTEEEFGDMKSWQWSSL